MRDNKIDDLQKQITALKNQSSGSHGSVIDVSYIGNHTSSSIQTFVITYADGTIKRIMVRDVYPAF